MSIKSVVTTGIFAGVLFTGGALAQTWIPPAEIAPKSSTPSAAAPANAAAPAKPAASADDARKTKEKACCER